MMINENTAKNTRRSFFKRSLALIGWGYAAVAHGFTPIVFDAQHGRDSTLHNQNAVLDVELTQWIKPLMFNKSEGELLVYRLDGIVTLYGSVHEAKDRLLCERFLQCHPSVSSIKNYLRLAV